MGNIEAAGMYASDFGCLEALLHKGPHCPLDTGGQETDPQVVRGSRTNDGNRDLRSLTGRTSEADRLLRRLGHGAEELLDRQ